MSAFPASLLLVGGHGKMGSALYKAWVKAGMKPDSIFIHDKNSDSVALETIKLAPECIVLAVKPQSMQELLPRLAKQFGNQSFYISIAAGKTIAYFEKYLGDAAIIRVMPNTPALIGEGISALCASEKATAAHKAIVDTLLKAAGQTLWLEDESLMDAVTAISGSGPAYVFLFLQSLAEAGIKHGLPEETARQLAFQTVIGSSKLAQSSPSSLAALRDDVTSKGGTTEAALNLLMEGNVFSGLIAQAINAAVKRSKDLAQ